MSLNKIKDLVVTKLETKEEYSHPDSYHENLPQHAFTMLIIAPKGSGKTNLICNLILKHYKGYFHRILISSPTVNNDEKWDLVKKTKHVLAENKKLEQELNSMKVKGKKLKVVFKDSMSLQEQITEKEGWDGNIPEEDFFADIDRIPSLIKSQQDILDRLKDLGVNEKRRYIIDRQLLIMDDQAGMFRQGIHSPLTNFVIKHRHTSTSVIVVTQAYKAIPKTIRSNCNAVIIFDIPNKSEMQAIYEENPNGLSYKDWEKLYQHATSEAYSFLYINTKFPKGERMFKNFDVQLQMKTLQPTKI
jgi:hypothetical protein